MIREFVAWDLQVAPLERNENACTVEVRVQLSLISTCKRYLALDVLQSCPMVRDSFHEDTGKRHVRMLICVKVV